jgi:hypothetical protein
MSDWGDLTGDWQAQATAPAPPRQAIEAMAARARREALAWRWTWRTVQACAAGIVVFAVWTALFTDRVPALKALVAFLAVLALGAWWASRGTMDALVSIDARSALDHLRAQRDRAAAMARFVAIDFAVYGLCALAFAVMTFGWAQSAAWIGIDLAGRSARELWPLWALLVAGVAYDLFRLRRSRVLRCRIEALLVALDPAASD